MKNVGSVIYKEVDFICKEQLGKSFGEVISMVPEAGLIKKVSPDKAKKKKKIRKEKRKLKKKSRKFLKKK